MAEMGTVLRVRASSAGHRHSHDQVGELLGSQQPHLIRSVICTLNLSVSKSRLPSLDQLVLLCVLLPVSSLFLRESMQGNIFDLIYRVFHIEPSLNSLIDLIANIQCRQQAQDSHGIISMKKPWIYHYLPCYILRMYNYQTYLRQQRIDQNCLHAQVSHQRTAIKRQRSMPTLIQAHKKRVEGFILTMIDKPHKVVPYQDPSPSFRPKQPQKNLSTSAFYLKRSSQHERIQQAVKENSELDKVPFRNTHSHQFRNSSDSNSPQKPMRYKPSSRTLRLQEHFEKQTLNYLPNSPSHSVHKVISRAERKNPKAAEAAGRQVFKAMLPTLHEKTFFKSVHSLYTELPSNCKKGTLRSNNERVQEQEEEGEVRKERKGVEHFSRRENSRQALVKCNMLRPLR